MSLSRCYVENIMQLKDIITVELFFLNAKTAVYNVSVLPPASCCCKQTLYDSPSLDPCSTSAQQTLPAGHKFLTWLSAA